MDRRFITFLALTLVLWTSFFVAQRFLVPPRPPVEEQAEQPAEEGQKPAAEKGEAIAKRDEKPPEVKPVEPPAIAAQKFPHQRVTLGSFDPASGYSGIYTFDNRGAALELVELNGKYRSVEDYSGYLGHHLALDDAKGGGAEVKLVAAGTPAALAKSAGQAGGLKAGDVIQAIDEQPIADARSLKNYLHEKTRSGQNITLTAVRKGAGAPLKFTTKLARRPLELISPETHEYKLANGQPFKTDTPDPLSLLVTLDNVGNRPLKATEKEFAGLPSLHESNWQVDEVGDDFVQFSFTLDESALSKIDKTGSLKIVKRYTLPKAEKPGEVPYHLNLQVSIHNLGSEAQSVAYRLGGPTGLPLEGWWYSTKLHPDWFTGAGARDIAWRQVGSNLPHRLLGCPKIVGEAKQTKKGEPALIPMLTGDQAAPFDYAGVDTPFFAAVVQPQPVAEGEPLRFRAFAEPVQEVDVIPKTRLRTADVSFLLTTSLASIEPGNQLTHNYRVFLGPKDPKVLSRYGLGSLIEYGWDIFGYPAVILRAVLEGLYSLTGLVGLPNYGIAIILLTVIVRTCMIPISLKQARSAAKMQELAPEVQKLKDKFPDDPMKQHAAIQELYKKHNFNMFAGCLPVFIQLPIFIGLYRCLSVDIDLRDAPLFSEHIQWAANLAGPDKLFYWKDWMPAIIADEADGWLGPFFNVFPLITVTLFLIQQKMFAPPATDEQTKMQQQMMTYMTVFMGVMFYKVPAGLCIYFITSSLWGICERKLLKTTKAGSGDGGGVAAKLPSKPASPNGSARAAALKKQRQKR